jgi:signal transduction histidine kinase
MKLSQISTNFIKQFNLLLFPPLRADLPLHSNQSVILSQSRERILTAMLRATTGLGLCSLLNLLPRLVRDEQWISIVIYFASLGAILVGAINRRIDYRLRAGLFLLIGYGVAVLDLVNYGLGEDARVFLFGFAVVAIMLLGPRVGLGALSLSVLTLAIVGWQISAGRFEPVSGSHVDSGILTTEAVIFTCLNFLLTAGLVMAALHVLLRDFDIAWQRERLAVNQVEQERDLLEYRVVERTSELAQARDEALAASRLKTELLAKVSHELRTPLSAILGFTEMLHLGMYGPLSVQQQQATAEVLGSTQDLTGLVNELLDQAQLDAEKLKLNLSPFRLADLVEGPLSRINILAQAKGLTMTTTIAPDQVRFQQILVNLVGNAVKFTPTGTVRVCFYRPDLAHWALQVSDTGPGIPIEAQAYIFEPFRQVDGSPTRRHGGAGLGLSIVKQLTTLMGGQITLESEIGQGSVFTITFPLDFIPEK